MPITEAVIVKFCWLDELLQLTPLKASKITNKNEKKSDVYTCRLAEGVICSPSVERAAHWLEMTFQACEETRLLPL